MIQKRMSSFQLWFIRGCYCFAAFLLVQLLMMRYVIAYTQHQNTIVTESMKSTPILDPIPLTVGVPIRIQIPIIGVDATVESVTLQSDGSMDVPTDPMNAGWYALGPRPGEVGNAVIDGHVNWWYGAPAIFPNLHKLVAGDMITTQDDQGITTSFIVRESKIYPASANAAEVFRASDAMAHLNIITCSGAWDTVTQQKKDRLVIFADLQQ